MMKLHYLFCIFVLSMVGCAHPISKFSYSPDSPQVPGEIEFENQSTKAKTYLWKFGDGQISEDVHPTHAYRSSGNYEVVLIAKDENGKENKSKKRIMVEAPQKCLVEIQTDYGNMLVELYDETPKHRDNFFALAEEGFYDGLLFHRVIDGFMIQGGDPDSKDAAEGKVLGSGGPGYQIEAEFHPELIHVKGALAAARQGDQINPEKKSSGSQFYIVHGRQVSEAELAAIAGQMDLRYTPEQIKAYTEIGGTPFLDTQYTVFGRVLEGLDVIDKIALQSGDGANRPLKDVKMKMVVIR